VAPRSKRPATATDSIEKSDEAAIGDAAADCIRHDRFWRDASTRNPSLADAIEFQADLESLSRIASREWSKLPRRLRADALRILIRRFGKLPTRLLLAAAMSVSPSPVRLVLRARNDRELPDAGRQRREFERDYRDARLLVAFEAHRAAGLTHYDALTAAARELGALSRGIDGVKKALNRARGRARKRGYVDPLAPSRAIARGGRVKRVKVRVSQLLKRGRPKKRRSTD
jgi:hypothetical protein